MSTESERRDLIEDLREEVERLTRQRNDAQDRIQTWSRCPKCGGIVPCTGYGCPCGTCRCGYTVTESEIAEVDPAEAYAALRQALAAVTEERDGLARWSCKECGAQFTAPHCSACVERADMREENVNLRCELSDAYATIAVRCEERDAQKWCADRLEQQLAEAQRQRDEAEQRAQDVAVAWVAASEWDAHYAECDVCVEEWSEYCEHGKVLARTLGVQTIRDKADAAASDILSAANGVSDAS